MEREGKRKWSVRRRLTISLGGSSLESVENEVRYLVSRHYWIGAVALLILGAVAGACSTLWTAAVLPATVLLISGLALAFLVGQPRLAMTPEELRVGRRHIEWSSIRRLDHTDWISPVVVRLTLDSGQRLLIIYPGDLVSAQSFLFEMRRHCTAALIDGYPHADVMPEILEQAEQAATAYGPSRYRVLRAEDEAEVERLFQKLKAVGRLDRDDS